MLSKGDASPCNARVSRVWPPSQLTIKKFRSTSIPLLSQGRITHRGILGLGHARTRLPMAFVPPLPTLREPACEKEASQLSPAHPRSGGEPSGASSPVRRSRASARANIPCKKPSPESNPFFRLDVSNNRRRTGHVRNIRGVLGIGKHSVFAATLFTRSIRTFHSV